MVMEFQLSQETLYDDDILDYVIKLKIPYFIGVKMRDELPSRSRINECGVLNLNTHLQSGSHWTCWYKRGKDRYYFDSFGEPPPPQLLCYLKTPSELERDLPAIRCNAITVQHDQSDECGSLCLYVLKQMSRGTSFSSILQLLEMRYSKISTPPLSIKI